MILKWMILFVTQSNKRTLLSIILYQTHFTNSNEPFIYATLLFIQIKNQTMIL